MFSYALPTAGSEVKVKPVDRLITMDDVDAALFDQVSEFRGKIQIDRQLTLEAFEIYTGIAKIVLEHATVRGNKGHFNTVLRGVPTDVQRLHFSSAAADRI